MLHRLVSHEDRVQVSRVETFKAMPVFAASTWHRKSEPGHRPAPLVFKSDADVRRFDVDGLRRLLARS